MQGPSVLPGNTNRERVVQAYQATSLRRQIHFVPFRPQDLVTDRRGAREGETHRNGCGAGCHSFDDTEASQSNSTYQRLPGKCAPTSQMAFCVDVQIKLAG